MNRLGGTKRLDLHSNRAMRRALVDPLASEAGEAYLQVGHYVAWELGEG